MLTNLLARLVATGVIEELPGSGVSHGHPAAYRIVRRRRGGALPKPGRSGGAGSSGGLPSPTSNHQVGWQTQAQATHCKCTPAMLQHSPAAAAAADSNLWW